MHAHICNIVFTLQTLINNDAPCLQIIINCFFRFKLPLKALFITVDRSVEGHGRVKNPDVAAGPEAGAELVPQPVGGHQGPRP